MGVLIAFAVKDKGPGPSLYTAAGDGDVVRDLQVNHTEIVHSIPAGAVNSSLAMAAGSVVGRRVGGNQGHGVFFQQLINGLTLGAIYGLIAIGYTMVYGIIGMINFAHGEIYMIGAFIAVIGFVDPAACSASAGCRWRIVLVLLLRHASPPPTAGRSSGGLPAVARLVQAGAADLGDRHVDLAAELRPDLAGRPRQADGARSSRAASSVQRRRLRRSAELAANHHLRA